MSQSNLLHEKKRTVIERLVMGTWGYITFAFASSSLVQVAENCLPWPLTMTHKVSCTFLLGVSLFFILFHPNEKNSVRLLPPPNIFSSV